MNKSLLIYIALFLSAALVLGSCKSSKEAGGSQGRVIALQAAEKGERIEAMQYHALHYNTLSAPLNAKITNGGKSNSADGQLRIKKGECIMLSLRMPIIGSELFRLLITPQQLVLIDRYNKQYMAESITELKEKYAFDFDYNDFEALFTNRLFMSGNRDIAENYQQFHLIEDEYNIYLSYKDKQHIDYAFLSDYTHRILETSIAMEEMDVRLQWLYSDFNRASNRQLFPMKEDITINADDTELKLSLTFKSVDVDTNFTVDHKLPTKYAKVTFKELLLMLN